MRRKSFVLLLLIMFMNINIIQAKTCTNLKYDESISIIKEVMKSYYIRGSNIQYNSSKTTYGGIAPEDSTSQDMKYFACSSYAYNVYSEAFGISNKKSFPTYSQDILNEAKEYYENKNNAFDGNFLMYYENTDTKDMYIYDNEVNFNDFVELIKPGDIFVYSWHVLMAYDVVINPDTGKKDVLILNSTQNPYIKTRLKSTTKLSLNLFENRYASKNLIEPLEINNEGTVKLLYLSDVEQFVSDEKITCSKKVCAVIRPFYESSNGNVMFNYETNDESCEKSGVRLKYPGLYIEKTVNVGDNTAVNIGDELTYKINIINKSNVEVNGQSVYKDFAVEEKISEYVELLEVHQCINDNCTKNEVKYGDRVNWNFETLNSGDSIELTFKVRIKDVIKNVSKTVSSEGKFYSVGNQDIYITTGVVENKIIPKVSLNKTYKECFKSNESNYTGLDLVNQIYLCTSGISYNLTEEKFDNLLKIKNAATSAGTSDVVYLNDETNSDIKISDIILNNYWNGIAEYNIDGVKTVLLPRWNGTKSLKRAKTIYSNHFKDGDVLVYSIEYDKYNTSSSDKYTNENGIYAYIYIDGKFVGINYNGTKYERNEFTYNYYDDLANNLYAGYKKLNSTNKEEVLEFVNYQTLFDKDYFFILRPELALKQVYNIEFIPSKTKYIQNKDTLDLVNEKINVIYNDGTEEYVSLSDSLVNITGFDNSNIGKKNITIEYANHKLSYEIEIIKDTNLDIENPKTGSNLINLFIFIIVLITFSIILEYLSQSKFNKLRKL